MKDLCVEFERATDDDAPQASLGDVLACLQEAAEEEAASPREAEAVALYALLHDLALSVYETEEDKAA